MKSSFLRGLLSPISLVMALVAASLAAVTPTHASSGLNDNMWDRYFVVGTNEHIFALAFLVLWAPYCILQCRRVLRIESKVRHGSYSRVAYTYTSNTVGIAAGAISAVTIVFLGSSAPYGVSLQWSDNTIALRGQSDIVAVVGAESFSTVFSSPILALVAHLSLWLIALVCAAALHFGLALRWQRTANAVTYVISSAIAVGSFGVFLDMPAIDPAAATNLGYALIWERLDSGVAVLSVICLIAVLLILSADGQLRSLPAALSTKWGLAVVVVLTFFCTLPLFGLATGTINERLAEALPGRHGSVDASVRTLVIPIIWASFLAFGLASRSRSYLMLELLRLGSSSRWLSRSVLKGLALSISCAIATLLFIAVSLETFQHGQLPMIDDYTTIMIFGLTLAVQTFNYCLLAITLYWYQPMDIAWPTAVGGLLVIGSSLLPMGPLATLVAPLGVDPGHPVLTWHGIILPVTCCVLWLVISTLAFRRSSAGIENLKS